VARGKKAGCLQLIWRGATIRGNTWSYAYDPRHRLPAGSYTAFVRAINRAGLGDPSVSNQFKAAPYRRAFVCRPGQC
jgi:hypothetical protein